MFKQFSVPQKIFGTTTLLLGVCYVGVLVYVQQAQAVGALPDWIQYNATVINIQKLDELDEDDMEYRLNTSHSVRYDNTANGSAQTVSIKGKARWFKNDALQKPWTDHTTDHTAEAGSSGWLTTTRACDRRITEDHRWRGQAYTNLINNQWDNPPEGGFAALGQNTANFFHDDYEPGDTPPNPVTNIHTE